VSVKSAPFYWVECDVCGTSANDGEDVSAWADSGYAQDSANDADYIHLPDGRDLCLKCRDGWVDCQGCFSAPMYETPELATAAGFEEIEDEWFCAECKAAALIPLGAADTRSTADEGVTA
jgi:hypothetical protein